MPEGLKPPLDMRAYRRQTERHLVIAVVLWLVIVGSVVIGLIYGWPAVFTGLMCLLPGAGVFLLVWVFLAGLEHIGRD